jgi:hypothetical protein
MDARRRKFVADAFATAIFWTVIYTPIFLFTSKSLDLALVGLGSSALVEVVFGGFFGRFLDWFRKASGA